jgi:hypothetical protein
MAKTEEELQEYIATYKSELIDEINSSTAKLFDHGNSTDIKLGSQLLTLGSLLFAIVGGFVINGSTIDNDGVKVIVTLTVITLVLSLGAGLKNLFDVSSFWVKSANHKHAEGKIVLDDNSETYNDLVNLREKLLLHRGEGVNSSDIKARIVQVISFSISVCFLFVLILIKIYSH